MKFRRWLDGFLKSLGFLKADSDREAAHGESMDALTIITLPARSQADRLEDERRLRQRVSQQILQGWRRGDWADMHTVAALHPEEVRTDPVASALMALACLQADDEPASRTWLRFCLDAGADPVWLTRLLLGGAETNLANACALMGQSDAAALHQQSAQSIQQACIDQAGIGSGHPSEARSLFNLSGISSAHFVSQAAP